MLRQKAETHIQDLPQQWLILRIHYSRDRTGTTGLPRIDPSGMWWCSSIGRASLFLLVHYSASRLCLFCVELPRRIVGKKGRWRFVIHMYLHPFQKRTRIASLYTCHVHASNFGHIRRGHHGVLGMVVVSLLSLFLFWSFLLLLLTTNFLLSVRDGSSKEYHDMRNGWFHGFHVPRSVPPNDRQTVFVIIIQ